jgi:two-component system sensor histidine kinase and response regulator WspE
MRPPNPGARPPRTQGTTLPDGLDLLGIFSAQVRGHLMQARAALANLERKPVDAETDHTLRRIFHTIKGAARAIGFSEIRDAAAAIEELFRERADGPAGMSAALSADTPAEMPAETKPNAGLVPLAGCALDYIEAILAERIRGGDLPSIEPLRDQVARFRRGEPLGQLRRDRDDAARRASSRGR